MSRYLSSSSSDKIDQWLSEIRNAPILLHPPHSAIEDIFNEAPPDIDDLQVPTFNYRQVTKKSDERKWRSEYLNILSRKELAMNQDRIRAYCDQAGLDQALRPELNTVESLMSLPTSETNELVTESRSVLKGEFVRVLHIRNSFWAEQRVLDALLCRRGLSPGMRVFCEMRQSECLYGCERAQAAAEYVRSYAVQLKLAIDFTSLLSAFPYPGTIEVEGESFSNRDSSSDRTVDSSTSSTVDVSSGKLIHCLRKQAVSEADFRDWKDRWVFQAGCRATRHPGNI